jgi:hypothetical protein
VAAHCGLITGDRKLCVSEGANSTLSSSILSSSLNMLKVL